MIEKPEKGLTSADIKKQIEDATKAAKAGNLPLTGMIAAEINANASTTEEKPKTASKSEPVTPATEKATVQSNESVDFKDWAKKKGIDWTTDDAVLSALHKSDQEFHKKRQAERAKEAVERPQGFYPPQPHGTQPNYAPPAYQPQNGYPPPPYAPVPQRQIVENIARQYGFAPDDVERLAAFNRDQFEAMIQQERERQKREWDTIRLDNEKNSVFRELSSDPVFRRPEVAIEYHSVLEQMQDADPQSFEKDPNAYRRAYDKALMNIARRNLEGRPLPEGNPLSAIGVTPPTTPPRPLGQGSGGGYNENENAIDPIAFAKLPVEEKKKVLEQMGLYAAR